MKGRFLKTWHAIYKAAYTVVCIRAELRWPDCSLDDQMDLVGEAL